MDLLPTIKYGEGIYNGMGGHLVEIIKPIDCSVWSCSCQQIQSSFTATDVPYKAGLELTIDYLVTQMVCIIMATEYSDIQKSQILNESLNRFVNQHVCASCEILMQIPYSI